MDPKQAFSEIFSEKENFIDLYAFCTGKKLEPSVLEYWPHSSTKLINAVTFLSKDSFIIFTAQSEITPDIPLCYLVHYSDLAFSWHNRNGDIENVPLPEFYIIYYGENKPQDWVISATAPNMTVNIHIHDLNYNRTYPHVATIGTLVGYSSFCKEYQK